MNEDTEDTHAHTDGLQTMAQLGGRTATAAIDDDDDLADDDDLDDDLDVDEIPMMIWMPISMILTSKTMPIWTM
jgi:hypothetical protein